MRSYLALCLFLLISCGKKGGGQNNGEIIEPPDPILREIKESEEELRIQIEIYSKKIMDLNGKTFLFQNLTLKKQASCLKGVATAIEYLPKKMKVAIQAVKGKFVLVGGSIALHPDNEELLYQTTPNGYPASQASGVTSKYSSYINCQIENPIAVSVHEWAHVYDNIHEEEFGTLISESLDYDRVHEQLLNYRRKLESSPIESFAYGLSRYLTSSKETLDIETIYFKSLFPDHIIKKIE